MAKDQIKKLIDDSRNTIRQEFDSSTKSITDEIGKLKKSALGKI